MQQNTHLSKVVFQLQLLTYFLSFKIYHLFIWQDLTPFSLVIDQFDCYSLTGVFFPQTTEPSAASLGLLSKSSNRGLR